MTPSLKEPLHPGTGLTLWHKAPVSVRVLVVFPCVRDGGNFPAYPDAAVEGYGPALCCAGPRLLLTLTSASSMQENKPGNPVPHPRVPPTPRHWPVLHPLYLPAGYKGVFPSPPRTCHPAFLGNLRFPGSRRLAGVMTQGGSVGHLACSKLHPLPHPHQKNMWDDPHPPFPSSSELSPQMSSPVANTHLSATALWPHG